MKAAVLAAGLGERLRPLTETRPKPMLPILGEPLLCRSIMMSLANPRVEEVIVVARKPAKSEVERLDCIEANASRIRVIVQDPPRGTGDALRKVVEEAGKDDYLVIYSDVYLARSEWSKVASMRPGDIVLAEVADASQYGVAIVDDDGVVRGFVEKPQPDKAPSNLALAGIYAIPSEYLKHLKSLRPSPRGELELTDLLNLMASEGGLNYITVREGPWRDVGRPWDYLLATRDALERELTARVKGEVHPTAILSGPVYVARGAYVGPFTVIEGPAYIGEDAKVGPSAHVRPYTALLRGVKVGFSVEVKASILLEAAKAPHLNYVGDSIIGEGVNLGAGTITANLRFDHKNVKMTVKGRRMDTGLRKLGAVIGGYAQTGINVSIMPGVKIGSYAWIWPGCVVWRDVASGERYRCWGGHE